MSTRSIRQLAEKKRYTLIKQQEQLHDLHCRKCEARLEQANVNSIDACIGCPIFEQSRAIGEQLNEITRSSRQQRYAKIFCKSLEVLTVRDYDVLQGMYTDREIAKLLKVRYAVFLEWKKRVVYGLEAAK